MRKDNNFRELGGIRTEDGRTVKHGCFYRSGALGYMDDDELTEVASCNIRHIMDFRSSFEKDRLPDPSLPGAEYHHMNAMSLPDGTEVDLSPKGIGAGMFTKENGDRFMEHFYGTLPFSPAYREMFDFIKRDEVPVLFHCTAGKDRTGIGAVLILLVLGCSEETAIEDYLKTNDFRAENTLSSTRHLGSCLRILSSTVFLLLIWAILTRSTSIVSFSPKISISELILDWLMACLILQIFLSISSSLEDTST